MFEPLEVGSSASNQIIKRQLVKERDLEDCHAGRDMECDKELKFLKGKKKQETVRLGENQQTHTKGKARIRTFSPDHHQTRL